MKYEKSRKKVIHFSRMLSEEGYFGPRSGTGGNVSVLTEDGAAIAVTPSGRSYHQLLPQDICILNPDDGSLLEGQLSPSIETGMHLAVYRNRGDAGAVIHTHQTFASIFALINHPIPPLFDEVTLHLGDTIEVVPYAISGSKQLEQNVVEKLNNGCSCYLLQNHGALTVASSLQEAYSKVELMEKCSQVYYYALTTGKEITTLPEDSIRVLTEDS